ncbi:GNAT family N-acetyltransferase [Paenibacillus sp. GSMTC-2017]|uniref:GNAT family N-acetyltransferase n=1 Tax=Paenibacillus sp. GSMTC-2017 TaxID=2794350 RepID=UPI0018D6D3C9|nr:GNAT family N-acetyltransferase [Paenibacillus sp. GSMTC-2017]MBH5320360.1 GNAT family N-acetyltransferase [Paenibacillus sp. GSMTC-2017]
MIKLAESKEANLVHEMMLLAFEEYRHIDVPSSALNETIVSIEESLSTGAEQALLYFKDELAVGSVRFTRNEKSLYFSRLSVSPIARGRGIAKSFLHWLEEHAKEQGISEMKCRVRMSIPQNIALYQSIGFIVIEEEEVINPNGFPVKTVLMKKVI